MKHKEGIVFIISVGLIWIAGAMSSFSWFNMGDDWKLNMLSWIVFCIGLVLNLYHCSLDNKRRNLNLKRPRNQK